MHFVPFFQRTNNSSQALQERVSREQNNNDVLWLPLSDDNSLQSVIICMINCIYISLKPTLCLKFLKSTRIGVCINEWVEIKMSACNYKCVCLDTQSEWALFRSQWYISTTATHIGDVFVPLPWFQARYRKESAQQRNAPSLPLVDNLLKDNTDGCALTALLHFYCPQAVRVEGGATWGQALNL